MYKRAYEPLDKYLRANKVLLIYGPRRAGKTTLLQNYLATTKFKYRLDSGDNIRVQQVLGSQDFNQILPYVEGYDLLAIDEAQNIPNIGIGLKILCDQVPGLSIIATGSSSFDLAGQVGEPLTGRKTTLTLFPFSQDELYASYNRFELREKLDDFLIYGSYPEVINTPTKKEKARIIEEIANSYLLKDILSFDRIKNSRKIFDLLKLLAYQIGCEVSLNELATQLAVDVKTIQRYLDLLEKTFVITSLGGFSRNLRKEITSKNKYYFLDTGIRNAVIAQFNSLDQREDAGQLWENFFIIDRLKFRTYTSLHANMYFWRTYDQQEIDLIEEREGKLFGYECKWSVTKTASAPRAWIQNYPNTEYSIINPGNYLDFLVEKRINH